VRFRLRRLAALNVAAGALLAVWAAYWQVVRGPDLAHDPRNPRLLLAEERVARGALLDRAGRPLAVTVWREGRPRRVYPHGEVFGHPVGYRSLRLGKTGLEAALDAELLGVGEAPPWRELERRLTGRRRGLDVMTTLDAGLQTSAWTALGATAGAVVVLDARAGAVLVSASRPAFDPNRLEETWAQLHRAPGSPLLDRALLGAYPPGATFRLVVLAAALSRGLVTLDGVAPCSARAEPHREVLWRKALSVPCDGAFGELAVRVGSSTLREVAEAFGFGTPPPVEPAAAAGQLPQVKDLDARRLRALGAGEGVLISPLQAAVVAATLARDGERPHPHFVLALRPADGQTVVRRQTPSPTRILAVEVARALRGALQEAAGGTLAGSVQNEPVAAGLADAGPGRPGWFVGYAPAGSPRLAVAVVVEHGDAEEAARVARTVFRQALRVVR
jgi:peptidoglycan glycosyltransferase